MPVTAAGLVVALGWCVDDFESAARTATPDVLRATRAILVVEDPDEDTRVRQLSAWGVKFVDELLGTQT